MSTFGNVSLRHLSVICVRFISLGVTNASWERERVGWEGTNGTRKGWVETNLPQHENMDIAELYFESFFFSGMAVLMIDGLDQLLTHLPSTLNLELCGSRCCALVQFRCSICCAASVSS